MSRLLPPRTVSGLSLVPPVALGVTLIVASLVTAGRGLDLMDESYVLRLIADPDASKAAGEVYLFSFVVHPLLAAMGDDIGRFRVLGILLLVAAAIPLSRDALELVAPASSPKWWSRLLVGTSVSAASLLLLTLGVRVLGYRAVAAVGLALVAWGLARWGRGLPVSGAALVGVGLWLAFVGRPPSALAVLVVVVALVLRFRLMTYQALASGVIAGGAVVAATLALAGMSPGESVAYLRGGLHVVGLLGDHASVTQMLGLVPIRVESLLVFGVPIALVAGAWWFMDRSVKERYRPFMGLAVTVLLICLAFVEARAATRLLSPDTQGLQILPIVLLIPISAVAVLAHGRARTKRALTYGQAYVLLLLVLPYTLSVGSNVTFVHTMPQATMFWVLALALAVQHAESPSGQWPSRLLTTAMTLTSCLVLIVLWVGYHDGPDGAQLSRATVPAHVQGGVLALRPEDALIAHELNMLAEREGIDSETPVVDLSGVGAGWALALGGHPVGRSHLYTTWGGRLDSARYALAQVPCIEISNAYLIYAANDSTGTARALEDAWGVSVPQDYAQVLAFKDVRYGRTWDMRVLRPGPAVAAALRC